MRVLQDVTAKDLCIGPDDCRRIRDPSGVAYVGVLDHPAATVCMFVLQRGASLPLHDHPGMHVFGKLLFGKLRVQSFDVFHGRLGGAVPPGARAAALRGIEEIGAGSAPYGLGPDEGNVHRIEALEDSVFFDVLAPPYDPAGGRGCQYYRADSLPSAVEVEPHPQGANATVASPGGQHDGTLPLFSLVPVRLPDFAMDHFEYKGPRFVL